MTVYVTVSESVFERFCCRDVDVQSYDLRNRLVGTHLKEARERKGWQLASALLRTAAEEEVKLLEVIRVI